MKMFVLKVHETMHSAKISLIGVFMHMRTQSRDKSNKQKDKVQRTMKLSHNGWQDFMMNEFP